MSDETGGSLPAPANPDGQLELWGEMLAVERERIAMMFWGGEEQRATAILLTTHLLAAGGFLAVGFFWGRRSRS